MSKFKPSISDINVVNKELHFVLSGDEKYGLDKSIVNGIRRTLLNDIPSIAFKTEETIPKKDITVVTNTGQLHNEMLLQRVSLLPLYINPDNYMKNYLFELKVKHDNSEMYTFVTANDFQIYPLKSDIQGKISSLDEDDDPEEIVTLLDTNDIENYDLKNPISQKQKDSILRPFDFRNKKNYCLITELKNTHDVDLSQEIHLYGVPSLSTGKDNARFQPVSCATYSFSKDESLIATIVKERIKLEKIEEEKIESFTQKLLLSESEKYYHRDSENESFKYDFKIKSVHQLTSPELFIKAISILIDKLDYLKLSFLKLLQDKESCISVDKINDYVYHYMVYDEGHTMGNIIQSHIVRRCIDENCILLMCAYKKPHPLEESMKLIVSLNPSHKVIKENEQRKYQTITNFFIEELEVIKQELKSLMKVAEDSF
jgi:DNA-directed RNA polymerase subunit L